MIVNRRVYNVKVGRMREAVELMREAQAQTREDGYSGAQRIYVSSMGQFNQLAVEGEYESLAEYEKTIAQWNARPTTPALMEKWREVTKGGTNEIWTVPD